MKSLKIFADTEHKNITFEQQLAEWKRDMLRSKYPTVTKQDVLNKGIIVLGGSVWGKIYTDSLIQNGVTPICIVDNNTSLHGGFYHDVPIKSVTAISCYPDSYILLASTHIREMAEQCSRLGCDRWIFPYAVNSFAETCGIGICSVIDFKTEQFVNDVYESLADDLSREVYRQFVKYFYVFDNDFSRFAHTLYFPEDLAELIDYSCFVDVGAYNGDTLADFLRVKRSLLRQLEYHAFEPESNSYTELCRYCSTLPQADQESIHTYNCALGDKDGTVGFRTVPSAQLASVRLNSAQRRIDEVFAGKNPTFIKADIEGAELKMLAGATETIKRCRPTLAISVYHKFADLWEIPQWITALNMGYDIYLRHAPRVFSDTVCYAIPH